MINKFEKIDGKKCVGCHEAPFFLQILCSVLFNASELQSTIQLVNVKFNVCC